MALKTFKPYTKSTRGTVVLDKSNLWKGAPYKPLTKGQNFTGGRNNNGRITSRHIGGGSKHKYRVIDFYRKALSSRWIRFCKPVYQMWISAKTYRQKFRRRTVHLSIRHVESIVQQHLRRELLKVTGGGVPAQMRRERRRNPSSSRWLGDRPRRGHRSRVR